MITISGGFINEATRMIATKNTESFRENYPDSIIIHYTAGSSAKSSAEWLQQPTVKASAHLVIGKQGEIYQLVSFEKISWHAGKSAYGGRAGYNNFSIGIELDNPGFLLQAGNEFVSSFGTKYPANEVIQAIHRNETSPRFWHIYTEAQMQACEEVCLALIKQYPNINQILGHEEIAPGRKQDPGPAFPLDNFRNRILYNNRQDDRDEAAPAFQKGKVIVDKLNIREGAGVEFQKIALPLPLNKEVEVLGERNGWYHVKIEVDGWVNKGYIAKV